MVNYCHTNLLLLATSVDVKHIFSCGHLVLSHIRNRLSAETMRAILCVGEWSQASFIQDEDVLAVTLAIYDEKNDVLDAVPKGWASIKSS